MAAKKNIPWKIGDSDHHGLDLPHILHYIDFELTAASSTCIEGRFIVSKKSMQPTGILHGGISALVAESVGSIGASVASGFNRVIGVELSINHLQPAPLGTPVLVKATPVNVGRRIQVWEVKFFAPKRSTEGSSSQDLSELKSSELRLIALSKLTATILPSGNEINSKDKRGFPSKL
eukprot:TRINITY_DN8727_c0_g1_i1.p1 TRINITY_DN8727_c0_g1~~TRINITY_DN8727_c0_g1_i1.p1  ORF type:complete len:177 (+),score=26.64 TRINITY_DN8727_c0_g1_i1:205-735(+)